MKNRISIKIKHGGSAVYLLKNKSKVVYVGQSRRVFVRFAGHTDKRFDELEIIWTRPHQRGIIEKELIALHRPKYNLTIKKRKRFKAPKIEYRYPPPKNRGWVLDALKKLKTAGQHFDVDTYSNRNDAIRLSKTINMHITSRRKENGKGFRIWRIK